MLLRGCNTRMFTVAVLMCLATCASAETSTWIHIGSAFPSRTQVQVQPVSLRTQPSTKSFVLPSSGLELPTEPDASAAASATSAIAKSAGSLQLQLPNAADQVGAVDTSTLEAPALSIPVLNAAIAVDTEVMSAQLAGKAASAAAVNSDDADTLGDVSTDAVTAQIGAASTGVSATQAVHAAAAGGDAIPASGSAAANSSSNINVGGATTTPAGKAPQMAGPGGPAKLAVAGITVRTAASSTAFNTPGTVLRNNAPVAATAGVAPAQVSEIQAANTASAGEEQQVAQPDELSPPVLSAFPVLKPAFAVKKPIVSVQISPITSSSSSPPPDVKVRSTGTISTSSPPIQSAISAAHSQKSTVASASNATAGAARPARGSESATKAAKVFLPLLWMKPPGASVPPPKPFIFKQKGATKTVLIGCSVPFEGSQKLVGQSVFNAMRMAIADVVPKELPGVNVNLTCLNSKCEDIPAHMAVKRFADDNAVGVIGDICSRASVAAAGVGSMEHLPVISPASTSPSLSDIDYFFRTVPSDRYQGVAAAGLLHAKQVRTVGVVYEDNAYGYGLAFNVIAGFTKDGGSVPVVYQFKSGQGNPTVAVQQIKQGIKSQKLGAVFLSTSNLTFASDFLVAAKAAGVTIPIYGGDALADSTLFQGLKGRPSVIANLTVLSVAPGSPEFVQAYSKYTGTKPSASYQAYAAHAYDAVVALLKAYSRAQASKDGPSIKQQLQMTDFKGVGGQVRFDKYGDLVPDDKSYVLAKFNTTSGDRMVKGFLAG